MSPLFFLGRPIPFWVVPAAVLLGLISTASAQPNYATPYYFTTLAGSGAEGLIDGTGTGAKFAFPNDVAVDASGNVFVADTDNARVRKITPAGVVTTLTGTGGTPLLVGGVRGIALDSNGIIYLGGFLSHTIRKISPAGVLSVFAGQTNTSGATDGTASAARFNLPVGLVVDGGGSVFIADSGNHTIRTITPIGPGLAIFDVPGVLPDPRLDVFTSAGGNVGENDNWSLTLTPSFTAVAAFSLPAGSRDAALLISLPVGSYTLQVRGVGEAPAKQLSKSTNDRDLSTREDGELPA
jgi:hypothetical protein